MEKNNAPEIRFKGFSGDWVERKLETLVDRVKSYSLSRDVETCEYTGYKYVHYGDIHTNVADIIDENSNLPNIKAELHELLQKGDLILADASEDYQGIATPAVVTIHTPYKLVAGLHTIALRPQNVAPLFLYYLFTTSIFKKHGYRVGTGMKVFGISFSNLVCFESNTPHLAEQTQIGNFFKQLDDAIALHRRELDQLKQAKQGFLQKMFLKEGEAVPEIRFAGFSGDWEERKLGDILIDKISNGIMNRPGKNELNIKHINVVNLYSPNCIHLDELEYINVRENALKKCNVQIGDIFLTRSSLKVEGIAQANILLDKGKLVFDDHIIRIKLIDEFEPFFVKESLNHSPIKKQFMAKSKTGTMTTIGQEDIASSTLSFPSKSEQTAIGNFFKQFDDTIALHERELETLKQTKKAFLQKMFI